MSKSIRVSALMLGVALAGPAVAQDQSVSRATRELPSFELMGFPITPVQVQVLGAAGVSARIQERSPTSTLMMGGMPASPHQMAVLTPRPKEAEAMTAVTSVKAGFPVRAAHSE
jgi:hypothetical protein